LKGERIRFLPIIKHPLPYSLSPLRERGRDEGYYYGG
jgi:hypothetical protein